MSVNLYRAPSIEPDTLDELVTGSLGYFLYKVPYFGVVPIWYIESVYTVKTKDNFGVEFKTKKTLVNTCKLEKISLGKNEIKYKYAKE